MDIIDAFSERSICVRTELGNHLGLGLTATAFLCQALYWTKVKEKSGESTWFYKSHIDWQKETLLTRQEQRTARKALRELGVLDEEVRGVPPTLYFRVNKTKLRELLDSDKLDNSKINDLEEEQPINNSNSTNQLNKNNQSSVQFQPINNSNSTNLYKEHRLHTENTTQITTEKKIYKKNSDSQAHEVFEFWKQATKHKLAKIDQKRLRKIKDRLAEGYTVDDLKKAILGCTRTPWNIGHNPEGKVYDSIELICRNADKVDMFMANCDKPPVPKTKATLESERFYYESAEVQNRINRGPGEIYSG